MICVDFHTHTLFSLCGLHTVLEIVNQAYKLGMKGVAITDHGLTLKGRLNSPFFERFVSPIPEVRVLKGVECNLLDTEGTIDFPAQYAQWLEVVLLGIHPNTAKGLGREAYSSMVVRAIEKNPSIDIISHPNDPNYPVDYLEIANAAKKEGVALELNNSKILYSRSEIDDALQLISACKKTGCTMALSSDMHSLHELGLDDSVRPLLDKESFPESLIINRTAEHAFAFVDSRRERKWKN